ncbi:MAG: patatin-like phospholipase family protein [Pseudomonadota bacterium]
MTYRILSMDGGNAGRAGVFLSGIERRAEALEKTFLANVNLFAGTSSGAVNAMLLAWFEDPVVALEAILRFEDEVRNQGPSNPLAVAGTLFGTNAAMPADKIKAFCDETFGEAAILSDLPRPVLIPAFQLDALDAHVAVDATGDEAVVPHRRWSTRLFTNMPGDPAASDLIADVAIRTMAMPIQYPIHQSITGIGPGYVDGGVFANNPAMAALTHSLASQKLDDISVLSLGVPRNLTGDRTHLSPDLHNGSADWGYRQWLLDPMNPLLLMDLFIQAGADAVNTQCGQLLGTRYLRVEPEVFEGAFWDRTDVTTELDANFNWLMSQSWIADAVKPAAKPAPKAAAKAAPKTTAKAAAKPTAKSASATTTKNTAGTTSST